MYPDSRIRGRRRSHHKHNNLDIFKNHEDRMDVVLSRSILLFALAGLTDSAPSITGSPGLVRGYDGDNIEMLWTTSDLPVADDLHHYVYYYQGYDGGNSAIMSVGNTVSYAPGYTGRLHSITSGNQVGFRLDGVTRTDAEGGKYNFRYDDIFVPSNSLEDDDAQLLIYYSPSQTDITGLPADIVEGDILTLTCSSTSNSAPPQIIKYSWMRNGQTLPPDRHTVSGSNDQTLTVNAVDRSDESYKCTAKEDGSTLEDHKEVVIDVKFEHVEAWDVFPEYVCEIEGRGAKLSWKYASHYSDVIEDIFWRYYGPDGAGSPATVMVYDGYSDTASPFGNYAGRVSYERGVRSASVVFSSTNMTYDDGVFEVDVTAGGEIIPKNRATLTIITCSRCKKIQP